MVQCCAVGRPIVAFHLPGLEAIVRDGENGRLCAEGDFPALLAGVRELLDDPSLRGRMALGAAATDLSAWGAEHMYGSLYGIYREALAVRAEA